MSYNIDEKHKSDLIDKKKPISDNEFQNNSISVHTVIYFIIYNLIGFICAFLSWQYNKYSKLHLKVFYSIIAYIFSPIFIIWYIYNKFKHSSSTSNSTSSSVYNTYHNNPKNIIGNSYISDNSSLNYF